MRTSCNGCRVLRKACGDDCPIRPCLHWIMTSPSQSNATLFLAKFYGRAGLLNLLHSGPANLRPSIFKSLLYEACGRIVNPIYGSAGLLWSGSWHLCQAAVDAVLTGAPIAQVSSESAVGCATPPLEASDIRHVPKRKLSAAGPDRLRKARSRRRFKRSASKTRRGEADEARRDQDERDEPGSHDSRGSQGSDADKELVEVGAGEQAAEGGHSELEPGLELSLGLEPRAGRAPEEREGNTDGCGGDTGVLGPGLDVRQ